MKELEKGRVKEVVPKNDDEAARGALELKKRLREIAQRGVIKLFNAAMAVQTKGEEGSKVVKGEEVVGIEKRKEEGIICPRVWALGSGQIQRDVILTEMSEQGFSVSSRQVGNDHFRRFTSN